MTIRSFLKSEDAGYSAEPFQNSIMPLRSFLEKEDAEYSAEPFQKLHAF